MTVRLGICYIESCRGARMRRRQPANPLLGRDRKGLVEVPDASAARGLLVSVTLQ